MSKEEILKAVKAAPFRPFTLLMADGRSYAVPSADHASVSPSGRTVVVYDDAGTNLLDAILVTAIHRAEVSNP